MSEESRYKLPVKTVQWGAMLLYYHESALELMQSDEYLKALKVLVALSDGVTYIVISAQKEPVPRAGDIAKGLAAHLDLAYNEVGGGIAIHSDEGFSFSRAPNTSHQGWDLHSSDASLQEKVLTMIQHWYKINV